MEYVYSVLLVTFQGMENVKELIPSARVQTQQMVTVWVVTRGTSWQGVTVWYSSKIPTVDSLMMMASVRSVWVSTSSQTADAHL